jgi:hypothetical protein
VFSTSAFRHAGRDGWVGPPDDAEESRSPGLRLAADYEAGFSH